MGLRSWFISALKVNVQSLPSEYSPLTPMTFELAGRKPSNEQGNKVTCNIRKVKDGGFLFSDCREFQLCLFSWHQVIITFTVMGFRRIFLLASQFWGKMIDHRFLELTFGKICFP